MNTRKETSRSLVEKVREIFTDETSYWFGRKIDRFFYFKDEEQSRIALDTAAEYIRAGFLPVIVANHQSHLDAVTMGQVTRYLHDRVNENGQSETPYSTYLMLVANLQLNVLMTVSAILP